MTDIVEAPVAVKDLKTLANEIRIAHAAAGNTAQNFLEHILTAGDGLIEARKQVKHGEWGAWLKRECALPERDLSERTAQAYMQIARGRAALEANPQRAADLSLRGALRLLQPPKPSPRRTPSRSSRSKANQRRFGRHDALGWWQQAPLEERRKFIDSIGLSALLAAAPEAWRAKVEAVLVPTRRPAAKDARAEEGENPNPIARQGETPTGGCTRHEGGNGCPEAKPKTNGYRKWTQEKTRHALLQMQRWNYKHPNDPCNYATMDRMRDFAGLRGKLSEMVS